MGQFIRLLVLILIGRCSSFCSQRRQMSLLKKVPVKAEISSDSTASAQGKTSVSNPLKGKTILVCGANGRVGSQVVRQLLRWGGAKEVRAAVRSTDEVEAYGRLSLETGAEDGRGTISPVWVTRQVSFEFTDAMSSYNLDRLTVVAGNLMDPDYVAQAVKGCDAVVFCAAPSQRVLADKLPFKLPKWGGGSDVNLVKGSVAREGVALAAEALAKDLKRRRFIGAGTQPISADGSIVNSDPTRFVLLSCLSEGGGLPGLGGPKGSAEQRGGESELARLAALSRTTLTYTIARCAAFDLDDFVYGTAPLRVSSPGEAEGGKSISRAGAAAFLAGALASPEVRNREVYVAADPGWKPPQLRKDTEV